MSNATTPAENEVSRLPASDSLLIRAIKSCRNDFGKAVVIVLATATLLIFMFAPKAWSGLAKFLYVLWTIGPPAFFMAEYGGVIWNDKDHDKYKHLQELAKSFWAAFLVVLAIVYLTNFDNKIVSDILTGTAKQNQASAEQENK